MVEILKFSILLSCCVLLYAKTLQQQQTKTGPLFAFFQKFFQSRGKSNLTADQNPETLIDDRRNSTQLTTYLLDFENNTAINFSQTDDPSGVGLLNYKNYSIIAFVFQKFDRNNNNKGILSFLGGNNRNNHSVDTNYVELQRFPSVLEYFLHRIQQYYSVYKYEDHSRPVHIDLSYLNSDKNKINATETIDDDTIEDTTETLSDEEYTTESNQ